MAVKLQDALIALIVVGGLITIMVAVAKSGSDSYGVTIDDSKYSVFNQTYATAIPITSQLQNKTTGLTAQSGLIDWLGGMFTQTVNAAKSVISSIGIFGELGNWIAYNLGIDSQYANILLGIFNAIVVILIVFGILAIVAPGIK